MVSVDQEKALEFLQKLDSKDGFGKTKHNRRILGIVETVKTSPYVFAVSKALANPKHDFVDIYHRSKGFSNPTSQQLREKYIYWAQKFPKQYGFKIEYAGQGNHFEFKIKKKNIS